MTATQSGANALALLEKQPFDVVLTDLRMEKVDGMQVLKKCRESWPDSEVIMITGFATLESAVEAMKHGAFYYIAKPFRLDEVRKVVAEALEKIRLKRENRELRAQIESYQGKVKIITQDAAMQRLLEMARQVAPTDCNVLITGESGTGKELFARYLHGHSGRGDGPFLAVNCGAFNEELLSNELFGHEKGAFTGAISDKKGLIETASGGTLFLDEITEMSPAMQVKLLRVIQEREVLRLGGTDAAQGGCALCRRHQPRPSGKHEKRQFPPGSLFPAQCGESPYSAAVAAQGGYSLAGLLLPQEILRPDEEGSAGNFPGGHVAAQGLRFPRQCARTGKYHRAGRGDLPAGTAIEAVHLPDDLRELTIRTFRRKDGRIPSLEEQEKDYIRWVLQEAGGNQTLAAQILGIDRVSLWRKLKRYELRCSRVAAANLDISVQNSFCSFL